MERTAGLWRAAGYADGGARPRSGCRTGSGGDASLENVIASFEALTNTVWSMSAGAGNAAMCGMGTTTAIKPAGAASGALPIWQLHSVPFAGFAGLFDSLPAQQSGLGSGLEALPCMPHAFPHVSAEHAAERLDPSVIPNATRSASNTREAIVAGRDFRTFQAL